jgi:predicted outer membrane protein
MRGRSSLPLLAASLLCLALLAGGCAATCGDYLPELPGRRWSNGAPASGQPADDARFLGCIARDGLAEVRLARLALDRSKDARIKGLAQGMLDDFGKSNDELQRVAAGLGLALPDDLDGTEQWDYRSLARLDGMYFDRYYVNMVAEYHVKEVRTFRHEAARSTDPSVHRYVLATLPMLRADRDRAQEMVPLFGWGRTYFGDVPQ